MSFKIILDNRRRPSARLVDRLADKAQRRPGVAASILLSTGLVLGLGASVGIAGVRNAQLSAKVEKQEAELAAVHANSQREINALAARLGELQAQANRLNALGERLTRAGQLEDGEFDFEAPVPTGGAGVAFPAAIWSFTIACTFLATTVFQPAKNPIPPVSIVRRSSPSP